MSAQDLFVRQKAELLKQEKGLEHCKPLGWYRRDALRSMATQWAIWGPGAFGGAALLLGGSLLFWAIAGAFVAGIIVAIRFPDALARADHKDWHETRAAASTQIQTEVFRDALRQHNSECRQNWA